MFSDECFQINVSTNIKIWKKKWKILLIYHLCSFFATEFIYFFSFSVNWWNRHHSMVLISFKIRLEIKESRTIFLVNLRSLFLKIIILMWVFDNKSKKVKRKWRQNFFSIWSEYLFIFWIAQEAYDIDVSKVNLNYIGILLE